MTRSADCPECAARRRRGWSAEYERWKRTAVSDVPDLLAAWADRKTRQVMVAGGFGRYRFRCPRGHHPRISPLTFMNSGCPSCRARETANRPRYLVDVDPEVSSQWHPTLNGELTPHEVVHDSKRNIWWRADCCGYEWQERVRDRNKYQRWRCPQCRTILDSLAWHDPGLAAEWSTANPDGPWNVRPTASISFLPEWICSVDPTHVWQAPLATRSLGADCPACRQVGKSRIELDHHTAASELFGKARSGLTLRDSAFTSRNVWSADIAVQLNDRTVLIEYDGSYWHLPAAKQLVDERKSLDFLAAGYIVVRLPEDGLPTLGIENPCYREICVYSSAPRPRQVMEDSRTWVTQLALPPTENCQTEFQ